jgi:lipopolysaccharide/colanic/teichoic acid biosynthesis glycosyltransferase
MSSNEIATPHVWQRALKRAFDVCGSTATLVIASPIMCGIAVAIWRQMGRPVLYRQTRVGLNEKTFKLWKFRTMSDARDATGALLPDVQRVTPLGSLLRRWSLDELPQIFNVLSGEMSIVGPRPLLVRYLPRYSARQRLRHRMKPGLTGLAQVNGRSALDWESRLAHDVDYAIRFSLGLDFVILMKSVAAIAHSSGAPGGGDNEFWGAAGPPANAPGSFPVESDERPDGTS